MVKGACSDVSQSVLVSHLRDAFGLPIASVSIAPRGEDADAYRAATAGGEHYFVRVQRGTADTHQETVYASLEVLRKECGLTSIVAPLRATDGHFISRFEAYTVAVFPFIEGTTAYDSPLSDSDWRGLAAVAPGWTWRRAADAWRPPLRICREGPPPPASPPAREEQGLQAARQRLP